MIARIKHADTDKPEAGYLPLRYTERAYWVPITEGPVPSSEAAFQACIAFVCNQMDELELLVGNRIEVIQDNIAALMSLPEQDSEIRVHGLLCSVDAGGVVTIPPKSQEPADDEDDEDYGIGLEDTLLETLEAVISQKQQIEDSVELVDLVLNQPLDVLSAVAEKNLDMLGDVAAIMVGVHRRDQTGNDSSLR